MEQAARDAQLSAGSAGGQAAGLSDGTWAGSAASDGNQWPGRRGRLWLALRVPGWLPAAAIYLLTGVAMWWQVWSSHPTSTMVCPCGDPASFEWFIAWPAYAISHGHSLFFTTAVHVPQGMNLLANTSVLALGVVLAPVTWLFGPVTSLNVALTAAPALSALAAYACLRRALGLRWPAAFVGGLLFSVSPFMLRNEAVGHLQVTFLALAPLIFWCCYELVITQRGSWLRWGLGLGVLVTLQFFVGLEILTIIALTTAMALCLAVLAVLSRPGVLEAKFPFAWRGFAVAGAVTAVLLAYPLWFTLAGPAHTSGADWNFPTVNGLWRVFLPLGQTQFLQAHLPMIGYLGPAGTTGGYLGIPAVAVLAVAVVVTRLPLARLCAALTVIAVWLSLGSVHVPVRKGGEPAWVLLPWRVFDRFPVLDKMTPANFSVVAVWFLAIAGALVVDRIWPAPRQAVRREAVTQETDPGGAATETAVARVHMTRIAVTRMMAAGAVSAVLVGSWLFSWPLPFTAPPINTPAWATHSGTHLPAGAVVLFYPFPSSYLDQALVWQATSGMKYRVVGGRGIVPGPGSVADHGFTPGTPEGTMSALTGHYAPHYYLRLPPLPAPATVRAFRNALRTWGVTNIVMAGGGHNDAYARQWLTIVMGTQPQPEDGAWVWNDVQKLIS